MESSERVSRSEVNEATEEQAISKKKDAVYMSK